MKVAPLLHGIVTLVVPGSHRYRAKGTSGTDSARYCYSVWLRHLVMGFNSGLNSDPKVVAELGPGDSLGIGIAALLSGCEQYFAFDIVAHAYAERNLKLFDELVVMFNARMEIPGNHEFPDVKPRLATYEFPRDLLNDDRLSRSLDSRRLKTIRQSLANTHRDDSLIQYRVPWSDADVIEKHSVDMIYSQAVLEHVDDLERTYRAMRLWLKPDGYMSHQIDFRCHDTADEWNGHWTYSDLAWKLIRGKRAYLVNREPHSTHIAMLERSEFKILCDQIVRSESELRRDQLAPRFRSISDQDLTTSGAFIQAAIGN